MTTIQNYDAEAAKTMKELRGNEMLAVKLEVSWVVVSSTET